MNGLEISLDHDKSNYDRHTFLAPKNIIIPDAIGMYHIINIFPNQ